MASDQNVRPQNRKRQHSEADLSRDNLPSLPSKRLKSSRNRYSASRFPPPDFWDNLSKVWLTKRALRELDRRNQAEYCAPTREPQAAPILTRHHLNQKDLQRFARHGGPELRDLQGHSELLETRIGSQHSSRSSHFFGSKQSKSTNLSITSSKTSNSQGSRRRSSAYNADFEQHLVDNNVYPEGYEYPNDRETPEPSNLDEIRRNLGVGRPSLSPSRFTDSDFRQYTQVNSRVINEREVMQNVLPILYGNSDIPSQQDLLYTKLESITNNATVTPKPDFYDGARREDIDKQVREDLALYIIPTKHLTAPVLPNFFIEAKAPRGSADVAKRQACHNGAIWARAMHKLQSYGSQEPVFDSNAYALTSTYHASTGTLQTYAAHITPSGPGGSPEYYMN